MAPRSAILLLTLAVLLTPGLAGAGTGPVSPPPAIDLAGLSCLGNGPASAPAVPALATPGIEGAVALTGIDCCSALERKCRQDCWDTGIFQFTCNPANCLSSCACN